MIPHRSAPARHRCAPARKEPSRRARPFSQLPRPLRSRPERSGQQARPSSRRTGALNSFWIAFERRKRLRQCGRLVHFPILLRRKADARPVRSTALVGAAERRRRRPRRRDQLGDRQSGFEDLGLQSSNVLLPDQFMIDWRNRVLPNLRLLGNERAEVSRDRSHVAMGQLVPCLRERICELIEDSRKSALKFFRKQGRTAKRGQWSASTARDALTCHTDPAPYRRPRHSSVATDSRRPGSWSVPIRS